MSEKMYTRLLRIYPSNSVRTYEGEALQLIRDRLRDETGFFKRAASLVGPRARSLNWASAGVPELVCGDGGNVAFAQCRWHSVLQDSGQGAAAAWIDSRRWYRISGRDRGFWICSESANRLLAHLGFEWTHVSDRIGDGASQSSHNV